MPNPEPTPEMIALAREVLARLEPNYVFAEQYRKGERDGIGTSIAVAAIAEVTERLLNPTEAMRAAYSEATDFYDHPTEFHVNLTRLEAYIATALRNGDHLHD